MNDMERIIYNQGERLIPGVTHDVSEMVRHKSSYNFFKLIIDRDIRQKLAEIPVRVLDFGCGVGYGCVMIAQIPGVLVTGVDVSPECIVYAREHYPGAAIEYLVISTDFVRAMPEYDYVVSRGVIEHIPKGLEVAAKMKWRNRLLFNVPYDEAPRNPHHLLLGVKEKDFAKFTDAELFYEDLNGITYDAKTKPVSPNMITCVCSKPFLPRVSDMAVSFPLPAWPETAG
ncbi:MAG: methyltransferase domain-containing protein [Bacillota bacterium]